MTGAAQSRPIRLLVVDDHAMLREGIRSVLGAPEFDVVGEAGTGEEAARVGEALQPDVVVLDISMPGGSGLDAVPRLVERIPGVRILMLSVHENLEYTLESVRAGAHGYLRKDSSPAELREAVRTVHAGENYFSAQLAAQFGQALRGGSAPEAPTSPPRVTDVLTAREREILVCIARGQTNRQTGAELGISARTVEAHRNSVMRKLGVRTVAGLTRVALEQNLL